MKTRLLCFLTALLFLLPSLACAECTHHDEDGRPYGLVPKGYVAPQPGVPGYSGDQCCAVCGAVVIHGSEIPALPEPDNREEKKQEEEQPAVPAAVPEAPVVSVEQPPAAQPEPEAPVVPAAQPQEKAQPETRPTENREQVPVQPAENKQETQPESRPADLPAPPPEEKKTEEKKPEQKQTNKPADPGKKTSGGGKTKKAERERFSDRFPYRRVRMTPAPDFDYILEFPGELLWPLPDSPFLDMFD